MIDQIKVLGRAMRVRHWVKNLLVFVPVFTGHEINNPSLLRAGALAFAVFCLAASGAYLYNDLRDLEADRLHRAKRHRPLAAGSFCVSNARILIPILWLLSLGIASVTLPPMFTVVLAIYIVVSSLYSLVLKQLVLFDVVLLTSMYCLRIVAGGIATGLFMSSWLLALSMFFFMSLAILKRYAELRESAVNGGVALANRGYIPEDAEILRVVGPVSGYLSVFLLALYINSDQARTLYESPALLWFAAPLLIYWITRLWLLTHRGVVKEDAVLFASRDPVTYVVAGLVAVVVYIANVAGGVVS